MRLYAQKWAYFGYLANLKLSQKPDLFLKLDWSAEWSRLLLFQKKTPRLMGCIEILPAMMNAIPLTLLSADPFESKGSARSISIAPERAFEPQLAPATGQSGKIVLPTMEGFCFEKIKHIAYLEANGNYTTLHFTDKRQILVCKTLREVELLLPERAFARIHRSHTIHLKHLKKYVRGKGGHVVLQNGSTLVVSAGQKELFLESLRIYFG